MVMSEWKPIDTAPKDRPILVKESDTGIRNIAKWVNNSWMMESYGLFRFYLYPDLWMEIPE